MKHRAMINCRYWLIAITLIFGTTLAHAANDYIVAPSGGDITGAALSALLATDNVNLQSSKGGKTGSGNVIIKDAVTWSANTTLTLTASNNVSITANINAGGSTAGLVISPNTSSGSEQPSGSGSYSLDNGASITLTGATPALTICNANYTVINSLGAAAEATTAPAISTLQGMAAAINLTKNFALGSNINASETSSWNTNQGFTPIGNSTKKFTGTLDGLGHTITNLSINQPTASDVGLFGYVGSGSVIRNVGLAGGSVTSSTTANNQRVGGLAGYNNGKIINSYTTGNVTGGTITAGSSQWIGGLAGLNQGDISNSYAIGNVTGSKTGTVAAGGLAGTCNGSVAVKATVSNSYANGNVTGASYAGGLVGTLDNTYSTVKDSYAVGNVSGASYAGGLVGVSNGQVSNSYATGGVKGKTNSGGLVGGSTAASVVGSYWNIQTSGQSNSAGGGTGLNTVQMMTMSSFSGWSIASASGSTAVWRIYEGSTAPLLRSFLTSITLMPAYDGTTQTGFSNYTTNIASPNTGNIFGSASGVTLSSTATAGSQTTAFTPSNFYSNQQGYDIGFASRTVTGTGSAANDLSITAPLTWTIGTLTLNAQGNININASLTGAAVALQYGQGAVAANNPSSYSLNNGAQINLPAGTTNFTTQLGSNGGVRSYTVITALGAAGSTTTTDLQGMSGNLALNYALGGNIDASAASGWNSNAGFAPVGSTSTASFTGTFAGLGHTISSLKIDRQTTDNVGLFGYTGSASTIRDVGLTAANVTGRNSTGALAGYNGGNIGSSYVAQVIVTGMGTGSSGSGGLAGTNAGVIGNSHASGAVTGIDDAGGLAGVNQETISNSYALVNVTNSIGQAGGLVGTNASGGSITASHAVGGVSGTGSEMGGLAGLNSGTISYSNALGKVGCGNTCTGGGGLVGNNSGSVSNSYATGGISGTGHNVGGLVGNNSVGSSSISASYATGSVVGQTNVGELVGNNGGAISNSYWNSDVNKTGIGTGTGTTNNTKGWAAAQMQSQSSFTGFSFVATSGAAGWVIVDGDGTLNNVGGVAGATSPMLASEYSTTINNAHQLQLMVMNHGASYVMVADVEAVGTGNGKEVWGAIGFVPVGNAKTPFTGSFDGLSHAIRNLSIQWSALANHVGLFGYTGISSTIRNVGLVGSIVTGGTHVGGLVGYNQGEISNSYAMGNVTGIIFKGSGDNIGGLVGNNSGTKASISNSYAMSFVYGRTDVGGLVGYNNSGTVSNSYAAANVNARGVNSGGLAGYNNGAISNSYARGSVIKNHDSGGLVGSNNSSVNDSYWDITASGQTSSDGGTPLNDTQMRQQSNFSSWDFTDIWQMQTYPALRNMPSGYAP